jgi:Spy/CpxP family protein refolding chaperone
MLKKNAVVILVVASAIMLSSVSMFGQAAAAPQAAPGASAPPKTAGDKDIELLREDIRAQRKEITAQNMNLTADEATKFWPIFDQYRKEAVKPNDDRWALIKEYASSYDTMTDAQANDLMKRANAVDEQLLALRMKYVPAFERVISPKKTALWYQIDRRIDLLLNLQLASVIPVVNTTK